MASVDSVDVIVVWKEVVCEDVDPFTHPPEATVEDPIRFSRIIGIWWHDLLTHVTIIRTYIIVIVIVNSKLLKRHLKAKRRAPAYSRALRQIRGVFQRIVRGRLRSVFQRVRECVKSE